jgi:hypothetical protein
MEMRKRFEVLANFNECDLGMITRQRRLRASYLQAEAEKQEYGAYNETKDTHHR